MRDPKRIPNILKKIEKIWLDNPDFRLGQLLVLALRPKVPCPQIFHDEDEALLQSLEKWFSKDLKALKRSELAYWEKYPDVSKIESSKLTIERVENFLFLIKEDHRDIIITPRSLMKLNGAPIEDRNWIMRQKERINILKEILSQIAEKNTIVEVQKGYRIY